MFIVDETVTLRDVDILSVETLYSILTDRLSVNLFLERRYSIDVMWQIVKKIIPLSRCDAGFQLSNGIIGQEWVHCNAPVDGWACCFDAGYGERTFATGETPTLAIYRSAVKVLILEKEK